MEAFLNSTPSSSGPADPPESRPKTVKFDNDFVDITDRRDNNLEALDRRKSTSDEASSGRYSKGPVLRLFSTHGQGKADPLHSKLTQLFRTKSTPSTSESESDKSAANSWMTAKLKQSSSTLPRRRRPTLSSKGSSSQYTQESKSSAEDEGHTRTSDAGEDADFPCEPLRSGSTVRSETANRAVLTFPLLLGIALNLEHQMLKHFRLTSRK
ncbi:hypothetical protein KVT40_008099 [Elsinoe batatas]|uniref:Uncharacterized protein n=1 Tax=Elsinoe batatas TaxID=2601811 RepID=A0A8K0KZL3_9PEZI|nr:hypothetical protein KVT40_008099 [Elsinoe batatas]